MPWKNASQGTKRLGSQRIWLLKLQAVVECFADNGAHQAIRPRGDVEQNRLQLVVIHHTVREYGFIRLLGDDLADEDSRLIVVAYALALERYRELFDDWRIDMRALMNVAAGLFDLVYLVACLHAKIVGNLHRILRGKRDRKSLGMLDVLGCLMPSQEQRDFIIVRLRSPGRVHRIRHAVLVIRPDDKHALRRNARFLSRKFYAHIQNLFSITIILKHNVYTTYLFYKVIKNPAKQIFRSL